MELDLPKDPNQLTFVYANILFDTDNPGIVPPQNERIGRIAQDLRQANDNVDIYGICEAHVTKKLGHNGLKLAELLGEEESIWFNHSRMKRGEHIGLIGRSALAAVPIDVGHNKIAATTQVSEDVSFTVAHFKYEKYFRGPVRAEQAENLMAEIGSKRRDILVLDSNSLTFGRPRKIIESCGYVSIAEALDMRRLRTFPHVEYPGMFPRGIRSILRPILGLDDVYIKGVEPIFVKLHPTKSDHLFIEGSVRL